MRNPVARFTIKAEVHDRFFRWCEAYKKKPSRMITSIIKDWLEDAETIDDSEGRNRMNTYQYEIEDFPSRERIANLDIEQARDLMQCSSAAWVLSVGFISPVTMRRITSIKIV